MEIRSFNPGDAHVSSSVGSWVNYFGAAPDKLSCLKTCEEEVQQTCIIVDGSDDWCSPAYSRPQTFVGDLIPVSKRNMNKTLYSYAELSHSLFTCSSVK